MGLNGYRYAMYGEGMEIARCRWMSSTVIRREESPLDVMMRALMYRVLLSSYLARSVSGMQPLGVWGWDGPGEGGRRLLSGR